MAPYAEARLWTTPNVLSLVRLPMAAAVWAVAPRPAATLALVGLAGLTDGLDGLAARRRRGRLAAAGVPPRVLEAEARLGGWLDPVCDKAFVLSALTALARAHRVPAWVGAMLTARELLLAPAFVNYRRLRRAGRIAPMDFTAGAWGKATTYLQLVALAQLALGVGRVRPVAAAAGLAGFVAALQYGIRGLEALRDPGGRGSRGADLRSAGCRG